NISIALARIWARRSSGSRRRRRTGDPAPFATGPGPVTASRSEPTGDEILHHLVAAREDPQDPGSGVELRDRVFGHVSVAAEQLQATVHDDAELIGGPVLRHGRGLDIEFTLQMPGEAVVEENPVGAGNGRAFGQFEP